VIYLCVKLFRKKSISLLQAFV